jgi:TolA-binding protein
MCPLCQGRLTHLRKARIDVAAAIPDPPDDLVEHILGTPAEPPRAPWIIALDRAVSLAGSVAMRPQTVMGTLLLLMVGTSLLLLRARPAGPGSVRITEHGVPAADPQPLPRSQFSVLSSSTADRRDPAPAKKEDDRVAKSEPDRDRPAKERDRDPKPSTTTDPPVAVATATADPQPDPPATAAKDPTPAPSATAPAAPPQDDAFASAMDDFKARKFAEATRGFDIVARGGGSQAPLAALYAARAERYSSGCTVAVSRFDALASRYVNTSVAAEGMWEAATCYRELGQTDRARQLFQALRRVAGYKERADKEIERLDARTQKP